MATDDMTVGRLILIISIESFVLVCLYILSRDWCVLLDILLIHFVRKQI